MLQPANQVLVIDDDEAAREWGGSCGPTGLVEMKSKKYLFFDWQDKSRERYPTLE